jgi:tetratricopeptide (TPR) repeat protein
MIKIHISAHWLFMAIFTVLIYPARAQVHIPDSIHRKAELEPSPERKVELYLTFVNKLAARSPDTAVAACNELIGQFEQEGLIYGSARAKSLKGWYMFFLTRYEESLRLGHDALQIQQNIADTPGIGLTLNRIALANMQFKRYRDARNYMQQAYGIFVQLHDSSRIDMVLNNLGTLETELQQYPQAISYYRQSLAIRLARNDTFWYAYSYFNIATMYNRMKQLDSSEYYHRLALRTFRQTGKKKVPALVSVEVGQLYASLKRYPEAIAYTCAGLAAAEEQNHVEIIMEGKKNLSELLFQTGKYKEAYLCDKEYQEMKSTFDSTNNASRVAEVEEQYKNAEMSTKLAVLTNEKLAADNSAQQLRLSLLIVVMVVLLLAFGITLVWLRRNQKQQIQRSEFNARISETRMVALRAQMSPHFIFNCINTAQSFIMDMQRDKAYAYLADFARLLRIVLENSEKPFIPLDDELEQLQLYISLEEIRFGQKFTWQISLDPELQGGVYEIPGMVLQPLVENAIGHGLLNRNDDLGRLEITVKRSGDLIECTVTDNGVGREKAHEIRSRKKISHRSVALLNITERLKMLQEQAGFAVSIETTDLFQNGEAAGTQVIIKLPFR